MINKTKRRTSISQKHLDSQIAILTHETRAPLTNLQSYCQLLANTPLSTQQRNYLNAIETTAQYLLNVTQSVFQKDENFQNNTQWLDVTATIQEAFTIITPLAKKKDVSLHIPYSQKLPTVLGNTTHLKQILINLLTNAIQTPQCSSISLEIITEHAKPLNQILITVKIHDNGSGLSAEQQKKLQSLFSKTTTVSIPTIKKNGIGLKICHNLAKQMGGEISITSHPYHGTTFQFSWLATKAPILPHFIVKQTRAVYQKKENEQFSLLVVEDNTASAQLIEHFLSPLALDIHWTTTGEEAIQLSDEHNFKLIMIDLSLPGQNGHTTIQKIRRFSKKNKATPLIAMSASISKVEERSLKKAGCTIILEKPITPQELHQIINSLTLNDSAYANLIDWETSMKKLGGKTDHTIQLYNDLMQEITTIFQILETEKQQKKYTQMQHSIHKLHGAAAFYQLQPLKELSSQLEHTLIKRKYGDIDNLFEQLDQMIKIILMEFSKFIK